MHYSLPLGKGVKRGDGWGDNSDKKCNLPDILTIESRRNPFDLSVHLLDRHGSNTSCLAGMVLGTISILLSHGLNLKEKQKQMIAEGIIYIYGMYQKEKLRDP